MEDGSIEESDVSEISTRPVDNMPVTLWTTVNDWLRARRGCKVPHFGATLVLV
ncbi:MAG: hypothetical protein V1792_04525 [Pseudomonadota bacterium]